MQIILDLKISSINKVNDIGKKIIFQVTRVIENFISLFIEQFDKEIELYKEVSQKEIDGLLSKLKQQLSMKFENMLAYENLVAEFKVNPNFNTVDPLLKIPCAEDIELNRQNQDHDLKVLQKKIHRRNLRGTSNKDMRECDRFLCPQCAEHIYGIIPYQYHLKQHGMLLKFQCPHCDFQTNIPKNLCNHLMGSHDDRINEIISNNMPCRIRSYTCIFTQIRFDKLHKLNSHLKQNINYHTFLEKR